MRTPTDRLREFLTARHECLSGHELARACGLPEAAMMDEIHAVRLLCDVLRERHVRLSEVVQALPASTRRDVGAQDVDAVLRDALQQHPLDTLVQALDHALDLDIEPRAHMAP